MVSRRANRNLSVRILIINCSCRNSARIINHSIRNPTTQTCNGRVSKRRHDLLDTSDVICKGLGLISQIIVQRNIEEYRDQVMSISQSFCINQDLVIYNVELPDLRSLGSHCANHAEIVRNDATIKSGQLIHIPITNLTRGIFHPCPSKPVSRSHIARLN
ncbi:hypothetical protein D3C81_1119390 [compost metagenome]